EEHAVDAFEIKAEDYLLKPVRPERLAEAIRRVAVSADVPVEGGETDTIPVELGGVTRFVSSADVMYVEAHGDDARLDPATRRHPLLRPRPPRPPSPPRHTRDIGGRGRLRLCTPK